MIIIDWTTEIVKRCSHLAGLGKLPPPCVQHSPLQALAILSITADVPIEHKLTPDSTMPVLAIPNVTGRHDLVDELLDKLTEAIAQPSHGFFHHVFSPANWLDQHGFDELILCSVQHTGDDTGRGDLLAHAARKAQHLTKQQDRLRNLHMRALLERDMPDLDPDYWPLCIPDRLAWLLAHQFDGDPTRAIRVQRRFQAFRLYGSLAHHLRAPAISQVIDGGRELAPALTKRLTLTRAQLGALREASPLHESLTSHHRQDFEHAVRHLQAHAVPLHQWPGGGKPAQHAAWHASPWLTFNELTLIRADYYGTDATTVRDAVRSFNDDLLSPPLADITRENGAPSVNCQTFLSSLALSPENLPAIQQFLACIRRALIGDRGPTAFQKAAQLWHRRAAAVAALRNENQTERPGWPPLCPPWTSCCGTYEIVPLTTAKAFVEEGNAHHHCVGTYYDACRSGGTQILSLRAHGTPVVTAEILVDARSSSIRVGQFKGLFDEVPDDPAVHQAMREFLHDLRTGAHPLNRQPLRAYRQWADQHVYYGSDSRPLPIFHARDAFPLYLALLPRRAPPDFDRWCEQTGLRQGLSAALRLLNKTAEPSSSD